MKRLLAIVSVTVLIAGCATSTTKPITKEQAIQIARDYVKKTSPDLDISQRPPSAEFFTNAVWSPHGNWTVGFAVPAPKGPDGKVVGVRPYISLDVFLTPEGKIINSLSHTP